MTGRHAEYQKSNVVSALESLREVPLEYMGKAWFSLVYQFSYISHFPSLCALHRHIIVIPQGISIICKLTCCLPFLISTRSAHRCITFIMYLIFSPSYLHICIVSRPVCGIPTQSLSYLRYTGWQGYFRNTFKASLLR
jgi:hypothetical protein